MDAEHAGQDGGGQGGNGAVERAWPGDDAEFTEAFGEAEGAGRLSSLAAGDQPVRGAVVADGGVAAPDVDQLADEVSEEFGQNDRFVAEMKPYLFVGGVYEVRRLMVDGQWAQGRS